MRVKIYAFAIINLLFVPDQDLIARLISAVGCRRCLLVLRCLSLAAVICLLISMWEFWAMIARVASVLLRTLAPKYERSERNSPKTRANGTKPLARRYHSLLWRTEKVTDPYPRSYDHDLA